MNQPELIIFAGANGSGKTTIAKDITTLKNIPFVNADEIAFQLDGNYKSNVSKASKIFIKEVHERFQKKQTFAIESTLSGRTLLRKIRIAKNLGYKIVTVYLFLYDPKSNIERIKTRVKNGGHHIQDDDVIRRFYRSIKMFWNDYKNLSDIWIVLYNSSNELKPVIKGSNKNIIEVFNEDLDRSLMENVNV